MKKFRISVIEIVGLIFFALVGLALIQFGMYCVFRIGDTLSYIILLLSLLGSFSCFCFVGFFLEDYFKDKDEFDDMSEDFIRGYGDGYDVGYDPDGWVQALENDEVLEDEFENYEESLEYYRGYKVGYLVGYRTSTGEEFVYSKNTFKADYLEEFVLVNS